MRQPKPFFRKFNKTWYVQIGRQQINLGREKDAAFLKYHELMADRGLAQETLKLVSDVLDEYLNWLHQNRSKATYDKAVHYLSHFVQRVGPAMTVDKLQGLHVTKWIESRKDWTPTTGNDVVSLIQRAFRWAVKRGHIRTSPVEVVEGKPRKQRRGTVFTPVQWEEIRAFVNDQQFGDLLDFMWATGCRPKEARTVEEGLKQGVDSLTLAQIMGHSDTSMLSKHYAHLARNPTYLRETARRLRAND